MHINQDNAQSKWAQKSDTNETPFIRVIPTERFFATRDLYSFETPFIRVIPTEHFFATRDLYSFKPPFISVIPTERQLATRGLPISTKKPIVGVSQCLLGDAVRYDGKSKANRIVLGKLSTIFELTPVCPEVEAGLSIPRPPVQLTGSIDNPKLTGRDNPAIDVSHTMNKYCLTKPAELNHLSGFIFTSRSPSCGLNSTPVFLNGSCITETGRGVFAAALCKHYPELPVIEDCELKNQALLDDFILSILTQRLWAKSS
ncbi:MAG: hypothetical protein COA54_12930 [Thiotrichaceae bacterium]|nr:MAG: hypothetical protein COA54_12930 [Thiotrichaceae bacterium]